MLCIAALYSTDLNSSRKPTDIGRNPGFSFYLSPAAVLRINSVYAPLLHRLGQRTKTNKTNMRPCVYYIQCGGLMEKHHEAYHETSMADVPRQCGHGPFPRIHYGVLDDVG